MGVRRTATVALAFVLAVIVMGLGQPAEARLPQQDGTGPATPPVVTPRSPVAAPYTLNAMKTSSEGSDGQQTPLFYLTDANGKPVYTYSTDTVGSTTLTCTGGCAIAFPPLKIAAGQQPTLDPIATGTIGTVTLADNSVVLTFNGMPLYEFVADVAGAIPNGNITV